MGEEACDQVELPAADPSKPSDKRTLLISGGYSRDEVYIGICNSTDDLPNDVIAVDGKELKRALRSMVIGEPRKRRRKT